MDYIFYVFPNVNDRLAPNFVDLQNLMKISPLKIQIMELNYVGNFEENFRIGWRTPFHEVTVVKFSKSNQIA